MVAAIAVIAIYALQRADISAKTAAAVVPSSKEELQLPVPQPEPVLVPGPQAIVNFDIDYDYPPIPQTEGTVRIPILAYHHIAPVPAGGSDLYVSPEVFDQQMAYLKAKNYRTVTPWQYYEILESGKNPTQKTVMLTFGDGNLDNYTTAFPILQKYGLTGNFYIIAGALQISAGQLQEMIAAGMTIEGHSMTHIGLGGIYDQGTLEREIVQSKHDIEAITGQQIFSFLYPNCTYNDSVISKVGGNYAMALACGAAIDNVFTDRFHLQRIYIYDSLEGFKQRLSGIIK